MGNVINFPTPNPVTDIVPEPGLSFGSTAPDFRQFIHGLALTLVPVFVVLGVSTETVALGWVGLGLGVFDAIVLAAPNAADKGRRITFAVGALIQAVLIGFGVANEEVIVTIVGAMVSSITSYIAFRYTQSSALAPASTVGNKAA